MTLDEDVARLLNQESRRAGEAFKQTVNRLLRLGLTSSKRPARKPFVVVPLELNLPAGMNYDNVEELLDELEGPGRK